MGSPSFWFHSLNISSPICLRQIQINVKITTTLTIFSIMHIRIIIELLVVNSLARYHQKGNAMHTIININIPRTQEGSLPVQVPLSSQVLISFPTRVYQLLQ